MRNKVDQLQREYLEILIKIKDEIRTEEYIHIVDEINVFWYLNRDIVQLYLSNITKEDKAYVFTGATYLDVDDFEHYPFVMMGNMHIVDDPLYKYTRILPGIESDDFFDTTMEQILNSIEDNIKILSNHSSVIMILPLQLVSKNEIISINDAVEYLFLDLFDTKILNMEMYFEKFQSLQDIVSQIKPGLEKLIIFEEGEDLNKALDERFKSYVSKNNIPLSKKKNDVFKFWIIIYGFLVQALHILLCSAEFNLIPYLRYRVTFQYVTLLGGNFYSFEDMEEILFKCRVAHILYNMLDKERYKMISFEDFHSILEEYNFSDKVEKDTQIKLNDSDTISIDEIVNILNKNIDKCFNKYVIR